MKPDNTFPLTIRFSQASGKRNDILDKLFLKYWNKSEKYLKLSFEADAAGDEKKKKVLMDLALHFRRVAYVFQ